MATTYYYNNLAISLSADAVTYNNDLYVPSIVSGDLSIFSLSNNTYTKETYQLPELSEGFSSCSVDSSGNVWLAGWSGTVIEYPSGTSYNINDILTGTDVVNDIPYFIGISGNLYSIDSGTISGIASFPVSGTYYLEDINNTIYTLCPSNNSIESYTLSGNFSSYTVSGMTVPTTMALTASGNYIAVGGWNNSVFSSGYQDMVSSVLTNGDAYLIGVNKTNNTINYYAPTSINSNTFTLKESYTGSGAPQYINNTPNGSYLFVSDPTNNTLQIYENSLEQLTLESSFTIDNCSVVVPITNNTQALVCQPNLNTITPLEQAGLTWNTQATVSLTNPTGGISVSTTTAYVGTTNGFSLLSYNGSAWIVLSTTSLSYTPTSFAVDLNNNIYMSGTASGTSYITVIAGTSIVGEVSWTGNVEQIFIKDEQLFVLDSSTNVIYGFELLNAINNENIVINNVTFTQNTVSNQTYSLLPKTYFTNIPTSSIGIIETYFGFFVYSASSSFQLLLKQPYTLDNCVVPIISIYNGTSWVLTQSFPVNDTISALGFDTNNNLYATSRYNTLYTINPSTGGITASTTIPPYNSGQANVPLGISSLTYINSHLYATSSLLNGIIELF